MKVKSTERIEIFVTKDIKDKLESQAQTLGIGVATLVKIFIKKALDETHGQI